MKITVISWKDERWSADKKALKDINELINKNTRKMKDPIGEKIFVVVGWIAISPFILRDFIVFGFKWLVKKIKRKG
jgi:hypothetical protein